MCLIIFAYRTHPALPLVLAANRDEFHSRLTRPAQFWTTDRQAADLLAGQDLEQGGTWLGISRGGRIAAVTNVRNPLGKTGSQSRGHLTRDFLLSDLSVNGYLQQLRSALDNYSGFNLLVGDRQGLYYLNSLDGRITELQPGIYGLSNAILDADWPKVRQGKEALENLIAEDQVSIDTLTHMMMNRHQASDAELPDTGIPADLEKQLSSSFIVNTQRGYGTRCTTAIVIDDTDTVRFSEQNYNADAEIVSRQLFNFILTKEQPQQN